LVSPASEGGRDGRYLLLVAGAPPYRRHPAAYVMSIPVEHVHRFRFKSSTIPVNLSTGSEATPEHNAGQ